jgi:hypothetical protein
MAERPKAMRLVFEDDFRGPRLDPSVWLPHYLPAWSSRAATAATYHMQDSCLHLTIPPNQGLWCADDHSPAMRVSGIQSGNFSGPVGSTVGQRRTELVSPYARNKSLSEAGPRIEAT